MVKEGAWRNQSSLQSDEKAKDLIKEALKNLIGITTEDLLRISEPAHQELRWLLTKKRLGKKSVVFVEGPEYAQTDSPVTVMDTEETIIYGEKLAEVFYEVLMEGLADVPKGALVIGDPVLQYLSTLQPGETDKGIARIASNISINKWSRQA